MRVACTITSTIVGILVLSFLILTSSITSADVVDDVVVTVPVSCNITDSLDTAHTATINPGQYQSDIGTTNFTVFCNDNSGYSIYAIGYSNEEYGNTKMLATINNELSPTNDINTGTNTSGANSSWSMKLIPVTTASSGTEQPYTPTIESDTNGSFSNYHIIPEEYTKVATFTSNTDFTIGSSLQSTYQVYIDNTKPAGTYAGKVKYTLVHPASHGAPVILNPNATDISEVTYLQDFAVVSDEDRESIVASMVPEQQYTIQDSRDNKYYTIAKYQAGTDNTTNQPIYDVWMTQNLDLDLGSNITYTNEDTDIGYDIKAGAYKTASWSPIRSTYETTASQIHEWCQGGSWNAEDNYCEDNNTPESYDPGNLYWNSVESNLNDWIEYYNSCDFSTSTPTCNQSKNPLSSYTSTTGIAQYHLGNYYNRAAALATNNISTLSESDAVKQSICPAGWTLPRTNTEKDSFYSLWSQYGFNNNSYNDINNNGIYDTGEDALWTEPLYFNNSGEFNGALMSTGYVGSFWSSILNENINYNNISTKPVGSLLNSEGLSIRCILRPVIPLLSVPLI